MKSEINENWNIYRNASISFSLKYFQLILKMYSLSSPMTSTLFFTILFVIPCVQSLRCSNNCTFQGLNLNSSDTFNLCTSLNQSNNDTDQLCQVKLMINPIENLVNGSFISRKATFSDSNRLLVRTHFPLNDSSVIIHIEYDCSVTDYCDIEFVRETLSSTWNKVSIKSIHKELVNRLYDPNNTHVLKTRHSAMVYINVQD